MGKFLTIVGGIVVASFCVTVGWKAKEESLKPKKEKPAKEPVDQDEPTVTEEPKVEVSVESAD